mmetsp:Transcript_37199/g.120420  ORF Transcript_37199/g.120420 Transcript_37199/m.120420 type:complete len:226 (-) Transcript_37199:38-715(-)
MDRRPVARPGRRHLPHKGHPRHRGQPEEVRLPGRAHDLQQRARRRVGRGRAARVEARLHRQELAARGAARRLQRLPRHPAARRAEARGAPLRGRGPRPVQGRPGRVGKGAGRRAALQEHARGGARRGRVALPGGARRRRPHLRPARRRPGHQEGVRANRPAARQASRCSEGLAWGSGIAWRARYRGDRNVVPHAHHRHTLTLALCARGYENSEYEITDVRAEKIA